MAINTGKVVVGGLVAAVINDVVQILANRFLLMERYTAEMNAFKPGFADAMMAGNAKFIYPVLGLVLGIALVWTYAAMRPRFGPGPRTAVYVAILFWIVSLINYYGDLTMMSVGLWWSFGFVGLVSLLISSVAGAALYKEDAV